MNQQITKQALLSVGVILISAILLLTWRTISDASDLSPVPAISPINQPAQTAANLNDKNTEEAINPELASQSESATTVATTAQTAPQDTITPEPTPTIEESGAPEGYVGFPPQCERMIWQTLPGEIPLRFTTSLNPLQTNTTVLSYDYYVNDALIQSSESNEMLYSDVVKGQTYDVHVIIRTDKGTTLRSSLCEETITIDRNWQ